MNYLSDCGIWEQKAWECAAGDGAIVRVLEQNGWSVVGTDIASGTDFLTADLPDGVEWIITNPPFNLAEAFIRRAVQHRVKFAFLLKSQYWHSKKRLPLFTEAPPVIDPTSHMEAGLHGARSVTSRHDVVCLGHGNISHGIHTTTKAIERKKRAGDFSSTLSLFVNVICQLAILLSQYALSMCAYCFTYPSIFAPHFLQYLFFLLKSDNRVGTLQRMLSPHSEHHQLKALIRFGLSPSVFCQYPCRTSTTSALGAFSLAASSASFQPRRYG